MGILKRLLGQRKKEAERCTVIVAASGRSTRMGEDKVLLPLGEVPVLLRTLWVLEGSPSVSEIIVVTREDLLVTVGQLCKDAGLTKTSKIIVGGKTRMDSVMAGLREVNSATELVAIHDAARPLVTQEIVEDTISMARGWGAAAPAVPVKDTIKRAVNGVVENTLDRSELFAIQTPQVFEHGLILGALEKATADGAELTDDCSAVERLGVPVYLTQGSYENIKLTTPEDIVTAEAILGRRGEL